MRARCLGGGAPWLVVVLLAVLASVAPHAQDPVSYTLRFPERQHRLMHVDVTFTGVPPGPLELRMSRTSPGRYALHEFAKNVFDVRATDASGQSLTVRRANPHQWDVTGHAGEVRVSYTVFGDRVDGTYLGIDSSHAHINMPAAILWARGYDDRPVRIRFEPPSGTSWQVATQLLPGGDPFAFTAPNLQYLMDSPAELSAFAQRTFTVADQGRPAVFRVVVHHEGTEADVDAFARDVEVIVREAGRVFGEFPAFEGDRFTFIADYRQGNGYDAMEHRNSTVLTLPTPLRSDRLNRLGGVSHEICHAWNGERIRPASLEPFDFEEANMSGELWLAEGFCNYYGTLVLRRGGFLTLGEYARELGDVLTAVLSAPGRQVRSPVEMSQLATFVDGARFTDPTVFDDTFISYYTWGEAIGLALDLTLRERTDGRLTLDDYMRALWTRFGRAPAARPGYVDSPYAPADVRRVLADVAGDAPFAADFVARYIEGREVADYQRLLAQAGLVLRPIAPARGHVGAFSLVDHPRGARVASAVPRGSPAYAAGLGRDDVIVSVAGAAVRRADDFSAAVASRRPGTDLPVTVERDGQRIDTVLRIAQDPRLEVVAVEDVNQPLSEAQRRFRAAWLRMDR